MREANWIDRLYLLLGRRETFRVAGDSMRPALEDGDAVMIVPTTVVSPGDIVLAAHPYKQSVKILKRLAAIDDAGRCELVGDNPSESTDSRTFGTVPIECIYGKAVCRLK
jgi:nickel-type superoxide dismutase maturation protease